MCNDLLNFDFGFTAVDENELEAVQSVKTEASTAAATSQELEDKLNRLYNSILPLLSNLKKNPEKEYILWPNRVEKIEQFEDLITLQFAKILPGTASSDSVEEYSDDEDDTAPPCDCRFRGSNNSSIRGGVKGLGSSSFSEQDTATIPVTSVSCLLGDGGRAFAPLLAEPLPC